MTDLRIGHGYDVHRLVKGRKLILGGVDIPYEMGLEGHSDADVLLHAVMDSLLGAAALYDIGRHFPDSDNAYKDIDSRVLLRHVCSLLAENSLCVSNIDCTIIAQRPKISPYIDKMRENIASDLKTDISRVNVKATTEEGLGFTGNMQGIASHAVSLICKCQE